jgi:hypothetical protein
MLIHVFQVKVPKGGVGADQLVESLELGVIERPIAPAGEQSVAHLI